MPTEGEEEEGEKEEKCRLSFFAAKQKAVDSSSRSDASRYDDDER
jgi:hypothetical protein